MNHKQVIKENTMLNDKQTENLSNIINDIVTEFNQNNYNYNFSFHSIFLDQDNDIIIKFFEEMEQFSVTLFQDHINILNYGSSQQLKQLENYMKVELS